MKQIALVGVVMAALIALVLWGKHFEGFKSVFPQGIFGKKKGEVSKNSLPSFEEVLSGRHSGREYDPSKEVALADLQHLVEAARSAPSCYNDQPWAFIICNRHIDPDSYEKVLSSLHEGNQLWAKDAPVLVVSLAETNFRRNGKPNRWAQYDTGAASLSLALKATSLGLMAHQMGGFNASQLQTLLEIPEEFIPMSVIAVGYERQGAEIPPRKRIEMTENFFLGKWGSPFSIGSTSP